MGDGMRPLIAVTTSEMRGVEAHEQTPHGEPPRKELALALSYPGSVEAAGGVPLVVPPMDHDAIEPLLAQVAGVCLSGGPDLDPAPLRRRAAPRGGPDRPRGGPLRGGAGPPGRLPAACRCWPSAAAPRP